jgi:two-component system, chemotaxis family, response regulator Rcp1
VRHIFLIEDNPGDVLLIRQTLEQQHIPLHLHVALDGAQALFMLAEERFEPDLILLDLNLPLVSGIRFLERSKPKAPVVVFSSSSSPADIRGSMELGAKEFVQKPTDWGEYAERVCRIVRDWLPVTDASTSL